jgi:hypothetical protein
VAGRREPYWQYYGVHFGRELTDDHFPEDFDRLIADFSYGRASEPGKRSLILAKRISPARYQILDGAHRAAILRYRGIERVEIAIPKGSG